MPLSPPAANAHPAEDVLEPEAPRVDSSARHVPEEADASGVDPGVARRRYTSTAQLFTTSLNREVPEAVAERLLAYAQRYDLELSDAGEECYPLQRSDGHWVLMITWPGLERICRATGRWMPGRTSVSEIAGQILMQGSCYLRYTRTCDTWVEVSDVARFASHFQRDLTAADLDQVQPLGDWSLIPEIKLSEIALYRATLKALGEIVGRHEIWMKYPAVQLHAAVLQHHQAPSAGRDRDAPPLK